MTFVLFPNIPLNYSVLFYRILSYQERLKELELFSLEKRSLMWVLSMYKYKTGGCKTDGAGLLSVVHMKGQEATNTSWHTRNFSWAWEKASLLWEWLKTREPREAVESLSLGYSEPDHTQAIYSGWPCSVHGSWTRWSASLSYFLTLRWFSKQVAPL